MNAKNLPLKFAFVALLVAVCIWSLYGKGLRYGIDLQGGHSLVFEITTTETEIAQLKEQVTRLEAQLAEEEAAAQQEQLQREIERAKASIERLESRQKREDTGDISQRMIAVLKNRIDPDNLRGLEWRPLSNNRIEIRMPAGQEGTRLAEAAYVRAMEDLERRNLTHRALGELIRLAPDEREAMIDARSHGSAEQAQRLREVVSTYEQVEQARQDATEAEARLAGAIEALNAARGTPDEAAARQAKDEAARAEGQAREAVEQAEASHDGARGEALARGRISPEEFQRDVLSLYMSPRDVEAERREGRKGQIERQQKLFDERLSAWLSRYPARKAELESLAAAYKGWWDRRQYLDDPSDLKRMIEKAGVLEFRIVSYLPGGRSKFVIPREKFRSYLDLLLQEGAEAVRKRDGEFIWLPLHEPPTEDDYLDLPYAKGNDGRYYMLLHNRDGFMMLHRTGPEGWSLTSARPDRDNSGRPCVLFEFDERGAKKFARLTDAHKPRDEEPGHAMAIVLDDEVYSAPVIQSTISSSGQITGRFSTREVSELARTLEAGALPARLNPVPVSENTFGPAIGERNREMGFTAAQWGLIAVGVFMLGYYLLAGGIADLALVLNIILVLGAMSLLTAVLTLPGIAGVILTIGIAVDANVLIFERLREEQAKGQSVRMAIRNAYSRAFSAIFDANVTTLIVCLILGWVGTEEVRGFGITLGLGVVFSMFTALVVTRWVFQLLLDKRVITQPVRMLAAVGTPKINWMSKRHFFWGLSLALMVLGVASLIGQGGDIWGIEFSSGTELVVKFKNDAMLEDPDTGEAELLNDGLVQRRFQAAARELGAEKLLATARVEKRINPAHVRDFLRDHNAEADGKILLAGWKGDKEFFQRLDGDGDGTLTREELAERLPQWEYQIATTVTDVQLIRDVEGKAFGAALQERQPVEFDWAGPEAAADESGDKRLRQFAALAAQDTARPPGVAWITRGLLEKADASDRYELEGYSVLFVVHGLSQPMTPAELRDRIREMRNQADYADLRFNQSRILPLQGAEGNEDACTAFAVAMRPSESLDENRMRTFQQKEQELLALAFGRSESGETRNFDAQIAGEMAVRAGMAILLSWLAIIGYLWFRFGNWRWGLAAVVCLVHDVIIVVGLIAVSGWLHTTWVGRALMIDSFKIDLPMIAAILTVIGYSVNDTIVVFDRIRENRGKLASVSGDVINRSVNQTLSRTLLTSGTTFIVVFIMYVWGGQGIHSFNYALLMGVLFGTYSSVAVASPLLMGFRKALVARVAGEPSVQTAK